MKRYKGLGRVFSFTLTQQLRQRGWRTTTIAVALACLLIPILSLTVAAQHQKNAAPEQNPVMEEGYTQEALDRADLTPEQRTLLTAPVEVTVTGGQTGEGETMGLLSMLLPFASLMLLYFLVLLYGQSTAASVILEKTSKLMDLFLVSVEPGAMVLGKVLATALAGLLQLAVWAAGLAGGFAIGGAVVRQTGVTLPLLEVLKGVGRLTGLFSVPAMLEAAGLLLAGFLLYCSLSAIGGSMAGKAEDLSSTNVLFSLVLVASFFCCMFAGGMDGMTSSARWLDYVPFTAILVTPSRVLLGQTSLLGGLVSLALVVVCAGVLTALAGRVYRLMSLYKGNPPTPRRVLRMLRERRRFIYKKGADIAVRTPFVSFTSRRMPPPRAAGEAAATAAGPEPWRTGGIKASPQR